MMRRLETPGPAATTFFSTPFLTPASGSRPVWNPDSLTSPRSTSTVTSGRSSRADGPCGQRVKAGRKALLPKPRFRAMADVAVAAEATLRPQPRSADRQPTQFDAAIERVDAGGEPAYLPDPIGLPRRSDAPATTSRGSPRWDCARPRDQIRDARNRATSTRGCAYGGDVAGVACGDPGSRGRGSGGASDQLGD